MVIAVPDPLWRWLGVLRVVVVKVVHLGHMVGDQHHAKLFGSAVALEKVGDGAVAHVDGPVPGRVASIVREVGIGAEREEQLAHLQVALKGGVVQGSVAGLCNMERRRKRRAGIRNRNECVRG